MIIYSWDIFSPLPIPSVEANRKEEPELMRVIQLIRHEISLWSKLTSERERSSKYLRSFYTLITHNDRPVAATTKSGQVVQTQTEAGAGVDPGKSSSSAALWPLGARAEDR